MTGKVVQKIGECKNEIATEKTSQISEPSLEQGDKMSNPYARNNDLSVLHPRIRDAIIEIEKTLNNEGIPFKVFEAFRYPEGKPDFSLKAAQSPEKLLLMQNLGIPIISMV